jgi:type IV pilus biogenesis protein CpaD/CtpE
MKHVWLLPALALCACTDPHQPFNPSFGDAVRANMAAQIINPVPRADPDPVTDGKRMSDAMQRYRTEKVYPPIPPIEATVRQGKAPDQPLDSGRAPASGPME